MENTEKFELTPEMLKSIAGRKLDNSIKAMLRYWKTYGHSLQEVLDERFAPAYTSPEMIEEVKAYWNSYDPQKK